jgi:hypothetical protein
MVQGGYEMTTGLDLLVGSWRVQSIRYVFSDTGETVEPFGPDPEGRMVLEPGGRIMFLFTRSARKPPENDVDRVALFNGMAAYTGTVRLDGPGSFITTVDLSWNPAFGGEQLRLFAVADDVLTVRTLATTVPMFAGRLHIAELVFNRERNSP